MSGLLHIQLAKSRGASRVIATDIDPWRLKTALRFGADEAISAKEDVPARIKEANDGRLADLVIVCTGVKKAVQQALKSVDRGGTILFFAPTSPGTMIPVHLLDVWQNEVSITTSYAGSPEDIKVAIDLLRTRTVNVRDMITHRFGLADIQKGFDLAAKAGESLKVVIEPQR
jgi:L-iditol 2-dehydrogenase